MAIEKEVEEAVKYLMDGGLDMITKIVTAAMEKENPKVNLNASVVLALCMLADEALRRRKH